jgi:hypothetical protein
MALTKVNATNIIDGTLPVSNGGTGLTTLGTAGQVLTVNGGATALQYSTPATTSPGGSTTQVQYNNAGAFGGDSGFVYTGGNVGITNTSPTDRLQIEKAGANCLLSVARTTGGAGGRLVMQHTESVGALQTTASVPLTFGTNDVERMRIDSSGNVKLSTANTVIQNSSGRTILNQSGSILQVQSFTLTTQSSFNLSGSGENKGASWADSGLQVSITPSSTSSKILVFGNINGGYGTSDNYNYQWQMLRNSTVVGSGVNGSYTWAAMGQFRQWASATSYIVPFQYLDSPATASAITYKMQINQTNYAQTFYINRSSEVSWQAATQCTITAMEIAG